MEVFARRFLTAAATLFSRRGVTRSDRRYYLILIYIYICMATYFDGVITCNYPSILYFDSRRRMSKLALRVWSCTLVSLELSADFELQPPWVLSQTVYDGHSLGRTWLTKVRHRKGNYKDGEARIWSLHWKSWRDVVVLLSWHEKRVYWSCPRVSLWEYIWGCGQTNTSPSSKKAYGDCVAETSFNSHRVSLSCTLVYSTPSSWDWKQNEHQKTAHPVIETKPTTKNNFPCSTLRPHSQRV